MFYEVDGGETIVGQSARLLPKARSQGLWKIIRRVVFEDILKRKPHIKNIASCYEEVSPAVQRYPWQLQMVLVSDGALSHIIIISERLRIVYYLQYLTDL